ncbi:MAG: sugar nucleotide-binding protein [Leptospiraceae bacterium]|nr:sugar nucleotide-binding protein [Leptospiraceae bacterium]
MAQERKDDSILIVGGDSSIGAALYDQYRRLGRSPWRTSRRAEREDKKLIHLDMLNPGSKPWGDLRPELVYICAALTSQKACEDDPELAEKVNVHCPCFLARLAAEQAAFVVFLSSNVVFSGEEPLLAADATKKPSSVYGDQKARVETYLESEGFPSAIVRFGKVITREMQLFRRWALQLRQGIKIEAFHDMYMAPVALPVAAEFLFRTGESKESGIYQLTANQDLSYYQAATFMAERMGLDSSLIIAVSSASLGLNPPKYTTLKCKGPEGADSFTPNPQDALDYFLEMTEE